MDYNKNNKDVSGSDLGSDFHPESRNVEFAFRMKNRREIFGLSQKELAKKIGSNKSTIQNYESGKNPSGKYLILIAKELKCSTGWLLMGEGPEPALPGDEAKPLYNKVDTEPPKMAQPEPEYQKHGGWTPRTDVKGWEVLGKAHDILSSGTMFAQALAANIHAFFHALELDQTVKDQTDRIDNLEKECEDLKNRLAAMEQRLGPLLEKDSDPENISVKVSKA